MLLWWLAPGLPPAARAGDESNLEALWTEAESERLADWPIVRTGVWSAGPPPCFRPGAGPALSGGAKQPGGDSRWAFSQVARAMAGARGRFEEGQPTPETDQRDSHWLDLLDRGQANAPASAAPLIRYQRALALFWSDRIPGARRSLGETDCTGGGPAASDPERGLRLACRWLSGRLKERREPGEGVEDFRAALREAMVTNLESGQMILQLRARQHLVEVNTADLWRDYLSALLAQPAARPLDPEADSLVRDLAESPGELAGQPEIVGMLKMLLVRQGRFGLLRDLPALEANAPDAARRLSDIADVAADSTREDGVPALPGRADGIELQNWIDHNCRRSERLGLSGPCPEATPEFAEWEVGWQGELDRQIQGVGPVGGWLRWFASAGLFVAFFLLAVWLLFPAFRRARHRQAHYHSKVRSGHFEESQGRRPASAARQGVTDD